MKKYVRTFIRGMVRYGLLIWLIFVLGYTFGLGFMIAWRHAAPSVSLVFVPGREA
jgi:hypothetical protein